MATAHPPGCYWVQPATGTIQRQCNPILAATLSQVGFVGSNGSPAGIGSSAFATFAAAQAYVQSNPTAARQAYSAVQKSAASDLGGINAIGDFFNRLTEKNTWVRVGEALAGAMLLYIALNALMRGTAAGNAVQSAKSGLKKTATVIGAAPK